MNGVAASEAGWLRTGDSLATLFSASAPAFTPIHTVKALTALAAVTTGTKSAYGIEIEIGGF
jgi:L-asparaginase II